MSMDPQLKARFVAALRSGDYKQGKKALKPSDNTFCCLGVLCDLVDPHGWKIDVSTLDHTSKSLHSFGSGTGNYLNDPEQFGLTVKDMRHLAEMNDGCQFTDEGKLHTFETIADYIEANL